ncbi:MAG: hypothetical protein IT204_25515 [Fimbriimonadaceae bacterium]|nr:hypothetical protein [Fimbriimonadaceae bacterium]
MAEHRVGWWTYLKAAFSFRMPLPGLGGIPVNYLCLFAGAVFAGLFLLAGRLNAAAGVLLLTAAYELLYLNLLANLPKFRALVKAEALAQQHSAAAQQPLQTVRLLGRDALGRYQRMAVICDDIGRLLNERQEADDASWVEALQTGGLNEIKELFARLLRHRERLLKHLNAPSSLQLPGQIKQLASELKRDLPEPVRRSREQTFEVLKQRAEQLQGMTTSCDLAAAELDRLEQHLALLRDQAAASGAVGEVAAQIDGVVEGMNDSAGWLLDSERMLGEDATATVSVDA